MKVTLKPALAKKIGALVIKSSKTSLPITDYVLFKRNKMYVTDLETTLVTNVVMDGELEELLIHKNDLIKLVGLSNEFELTGDTVIEKDWRYVDGERKEVDVNEFFVNAQVGTRKMRYSTLDPSDFPKVYAGKSYLSVTTTDERSSLRVWDENLAEKLGVSLNTEFAQGATIGATDIQMMKALLPCAGQDDTRPTMSAVCLTEGTIVATNAHILAYQKLKPSFLDKFKELIIPRNAVKVLGDLPIESDFFVTVSVRMGEKLFEPTLKHLEEKLKIFIDKEKHVKTEALVELVTFGQKSFSSSTYLTLVNEDFSVVVRVTDGKYPNYKAVIPQDNDTKVTLTNLKAFNDEMKFALDFANKTTKQVVFNFSKNGSKIKTEDLDLDKSYENELPMMETTEGGIRIGFNGSFMTTLLGVVDQLNKLSGEEGIELAMSVPSRACVVSGKALVMPVLINR